MNGVAFHSSNFIVIDVGVSLLKAQLLGGV
jgi:hypothetical protein